MNNKYFKWLRGGFLGALALVGLTACEDDHFDLNSSTATTTIWENIKANDQLKDFAQILEKTHVTRSENIDQSDLTYAELLNTPQTFTVWAPKDGTYDASELLATLESGDERRVEKEFIRNHVARYNYPGVIGDFMVPMMNKKTNRYEVTGSGSTFRNIPVLGVNAPASNGSLHVLDGKTAFFPSLSDVMRGESNEGFDSLAAFVKNEVDTIYFLPGSSTPGSTVDGEVIYVDSVWIRTSKISGALVGDIENEDSLFVSAFPTTEGWDKAVEKVSKFYTYLDNNARDRRAKYPFREGTSSTTRFERFDGDSMQYIITRAQMLRNMNFSLYSQPDFDVKNASIESVKKFLNETDRLVLSSGKVLYNDETFKIADIFRGSEIVEASNGFYYRLNDYNYVPNRVWQDTINVETEYSYSWEEYGMEETQSKATTTVIDVASNVVNPDIKGEVSNNIVFIRPTSTTGLIKPVFKIHGVLSGKYRVKIVMVPQNYIPMYTFTADPNLPVKFKAVISTDFRTNGSAVEKTSADMVNDPTKVDTLTLFEEIEMKKSYMGLNDSYVTLRLEARTEDRKNFTRAMYIDRIILEPLDEE